MLHSIAPLRHRWLLDVATAGTDRLVPARANHLEHRRDAGEPFGDVLTEALHGAVALGADRIRSEHAVFTRQVWRQRLLGRRLATCRWLFSPDLRMLYVGDVASGAQILELQFAPLDLSGELLRLAAEVHSLELVD